MKYRCIADFVVVTVIIVAASGLIVFAIASQNASRRLERKLAAHEANLTQITEQLMLIGTTTTTTTMSSKPTESDITVPTTAQRGSNDITDATTTTVQPVSVERSVAPAYEQPRISTAGAMNAATTTTIVTRAAVRTRKIPAYITTTINAAVDRAQSSRRITRLKAKLMPAAIVAARAATNTLEESTAWKTLTSHPNSLVQLFPSRAMRVVQEVVRSLRKDTNVVIETSLGKIRGRFQKYRSGERGGYYSFKGIRYGEAPIGARRFRAAAPEKPWLGVRDASREGNSCPHKNMILDTFKGNEDCLFLNVFTTRLPREDDELQLPVMVWLHGGGYSFGSGNTFLYGPDYLVAEDIVLVTLNYRLGPLGFLTAGPDAPGNQGLKDQVLALKWVRDNIAAFGGDPKQVTVFGESAGASSVQMLLLSPLAAGLFQRAISQSGSALNPWSMADSSSERAFRLAANLGYVGANDTDEILEFLRRVPAMKLVEAAPTTLTVEDSRNNIGLPFVPVVEGYWNAEGGREVYYEEPFMTQHPSEMYQQHRFHSNVPYMTGYNTHEAMLFIRRLRKNPKLLEIIENDFARMVPRDLNVTDDRERVTRDIRQFYLGNKQVGIESVDEMIALLTDLMFLQGIRKTARNHAKYGSAPVYMYRFSYDGALGLYKRMLGLTRPGVCHGDEMGYLFKFGFFNLSLDPRSTEVLVKNRMVRMWTNFAKYGNPTPQNVEDTMLTTNWTPINPQTVMEDINYLDISVNLNMRSNPESERQQFWDYMYEHFNGAAM
ncbi:esterase E4 isoform X1 [Bactrocera neohumeralis]|uniref:esterase E4 isoform X1 n=1 Tax=Bactrocera neohumeralis TaxID=98809 RepID=UPI00216562B6|nr:esterase E4 isoform X1 [Bactrocera neohumeralis]